ncbi:relaxase domain-containing protein [Methylobacterium sp. BTF04]|uniref:MobF family relaxase n=1 Tax=Methylobacterium sp. BTF04 TaxID=2708300 RepID=UPI0013D74937|nr:MobF family relaxase [Methylobacterium sp. BTF04]NEU12710.1 relaxase domain-containing protein [Methylobacterium sp. BTF04]
MTASLHTLGAGSSAGNYYTNDPYRETQNRDEYYAQDGGGRWWTSAGSVVRDEAAIDLKSFQDLCAGRDPRTGQSLVRGAGEGHRAGWDVTLTACKTFSILWADGGSNQRSQLESIHAAAVTEALEFLRDEGLVEVRLGAGGYLREQPTDLMVGRFDHYTTRAGDPNCHTHCVLLNVAKLPDGKYRTLEPSKLFDWQKVVGSAYRAALAEGLSREFGLSLRAAGQGQFEIRGIPDAVIEAFSKRSVEIEAAIGGDRKSASGSQKEVAALSTRDAKADLPTGAELERRWRDELSAFDIDPWTAVREASRARSLEQDQEREHEQDLTPEPDFDPPEITGETPVARAASALFRHQNVIDRKSLVEQALNEAALQGIGIAAVKAEIAALEERGQLLRLNQSDPEACWTTPGIAMAEAALLRAADRADVGSRFRSEAVTTAIDAAPQLSAEQRQAVIHVTAPEAGGVSVLEAGAGTGKTVTANVIVAAAKASGLKVVGLAPSWTAADELAATTGIETFAIAKWRHDLEHGRIPPLDADTVILCDESGMVGTKDLAFVLSAAAAAPNGGARAILLGDRRQLAAVPGGSALRAVVDVLGRHATLSEVRRQQVQWQRAASILMARGEVEAGLRAYARHERIELVSGSSPAQERAIALWTQARASYCNDEVLIVTRRNRDAAVLNTAARAVLRAEAQITGVDVAVRARDRENKPITLDLAVGDKIRFGEGIRQHGIRNGTRAIVEAIGPDAHGTLQLTVRLDDGRRVEDAYTAFVRDRIPGRRIAPTLPRISLAYAGTAYSVQGKTASSCVYYGATASDARELYVGLTRHRHDARLVVERDRLEAAVRSRASDARMAPSTAELQERLFVEARRYNEKVNVVDHVEDRAAFVRTGMIPAASKDIRLDLRRGFDAGRAFRAVMQEISAAPGMMLRQLGRLGQQTRRLLPQHIARVIDALRKPSVEHGLDHRRSQGRSGPAIER